VAVHEFVKLTRVRYSAVFLFSDPGLVVSSSTGESGRVPKADGSRCLCAVVWSHDRCQEVPRPTHQQLVFVKPVPVATLPVFSRCRRALSSVRQKLACLVKCQCFVRRVLAVKRLNELRLQRRRLCACVTLQSWVSLHRTKCLCFLV
jgi:hypothetical protein